MKNKKGEVRESEPKYKATSYKGSVPRLRFPEFVCEGSWPYHYGNEMFDPITNKNHNSDLPILAISQEHGPVPRDEIDYKVVVTDKSIESYKVIEVGDFVISLRSFQGGIEYSEHRGICSPAYIILRAKHENIDKQFFRYYYKTENYIKELNKNIEGIRDGKMVSYDQFSKIRLPSPSRKEQRNIAACLSSLDNLLAAHAKKLESLKDYKKGLMQLLFPTGGESVPRMRFPEFRNAGEWKIVPLCETNTNMDNKRVPITANERAKGDIPYYGATGIIDYVEGFLFDEDILCISEDGANLSARTYPIAFSVSGKSWVNNHAHVLKFKEKATQVIIENYINHIDLNDFLTGMAQPKLNREKLAIIPIPLPGLLEQRGIATALSSLDSLIAAEKRKIEEFKLHKRALMQGLFPSPEEED